MSGLTNSTMGANFTTIYSSGNYAGMPLLFNPNICNFTSAVAKEVVAAKNLMATGLRNHLAQAVSKLPSSEGMSAEVATNRIAKALFELSYSSTGVNSEFQSYGKTEPSLVSQGWNAVTSPVTVPTRWLASCIWTPPTPINCDATPLQLDQEAFVFCEAFKSFAAETQLTHAKQQCPEVLPDINLIGNNVIQNFSAYWAASNDGQIDFSFNAREARAFWETSLKSSFCNNTDVEKRFCPDEASLPPTSFLDWKNRFFDLVKGRLPSTIETELASTQPNEPSSKVEL